MDVKHRGSGTMPQYLTEWFDTEANSLVIGARTVRLVDGRGHTETNGLQGPGQGTGP